MKRRTFMGTVAVAGMAPQVKAEETKAASKDVTRKLAHYLVEAKYEDLPAPVRNEAQRTLLNWAGCAIGGSRHETVDIAISALTPFSGPAQASVLGRRERMDIMHAALM